MKYQLHMLPSYGVSELAASRASGLVVGKKYLGAGSVVMLVANSFNGKNIFRPCELRNSDHNGQKTTQRHSHNIHRRYQGSAGLQRPKFAMKHSPLERYQADRRLRIASATDINPFPFPFVCPKTTDRAKSSRIESNNPSFSMSRCSSINSDMPIMRTANDTVKAFPTYQR